MNTGQVDSPPPLPPWLAPVLVFVLGAVTIIGFTAWMLGKGREEEHAEEMMERLAAAATNDVATDAELLAFTLARGKLVYSAHCASCHGADLRGSPSEHAPDLTDEFWLISGEDIDTFQMHPSDIERIVRVGIHDISHKDTLNLSDMPPFGEAGRIGLPEKELAELAEEQRPILTREEIGDLTELMLKVSGQGGDEERARRGEALYFGYAGCFDCHAPDYQGDPGNGSANLTLPNTWLYGSDREHIFESIEMGRLGISPAFEGKLSPEDIKAVSVYVMERPPS